MFDEKTILARLQNGEDIQKIADEMAAAINSANKAYTDEQARKAEEAARKAAQEAEAAKRNEIQKKEDLQDVIDQFHMWLDAYYSIDDLDEIFNEIDADTVLDIISAVEEYAKAMAGLKSVFNTKPVQVKAAPIGTKVIKSNTPPKSADETITQFLNKMGW